MTTMTQDANGLLDAVIARHQLKNDAALARLLSVNTPVISKLRHHRLLAGDSMVLRCVDDYLAGQRFPLSMLAHLD